MKISNKKKMSKSIKIKNDYYLEDYIQFKTLEGINFDDVRKGGKLYKSFIGTVSHIENGNIVWYYLINIRHRNGIGDGENFGLQLRKPLFSGSNDFQWRFQNNNSWSNWTLL